MRIFIAHSCFKRMVFKAILLPDIHNFTYFYGQDMLGYAMICKGMEILRGKETLKNSGKNGKTRK